MSFPPGHIPGFHLPGTLIPIGAVVQQEDEAKQAAKRRAALLLLLSD
jgi:hypothetical protein